ncbi:MAG: hypothetical protein QM775_03520 [Pirellulales bacterium]
MERTGSCSSWAVVVSAEIGVAPAAKAKASLINTPRNCTVSTYTIKVKSPKAPSQGTALLRRRFDERQSCAAALRDDLEADHGQHHRHGDQRHVDPTAGRL